MMHKVSINISYIRLFLFYFIQFYVICQNKSTGRTAIPEGIAIEFLSSFVSSTIL